MKASRGTAREIAERILKEQTEWLAQKWDDFKAGDASAALTEEEQNFLMLQKKLEQEGEVAEAQVSFLRGLSDEQLSEFLTDLQHSVAQGEGLN